MHAHHVLATAVRGRLASRMVGWNAIRLGCGGGNAGCHQASGRNYKQGLRHLLFLVVRRYPNEVNTPSNGALKTTAYLLKKVSEAVLNAELLSTGVFFVRCYLDVCRSVQRRC